MDDDKAEVWQGTLALMILKTLETMGPLHGYGVARRIEQTSGDRLSVNYGTIYPALRRLEALALVTSGWEKDEKARKEGRPRRRYYELTPAGRRQLAEAESRYRAVGRLFPKRSTS